MTYCYPHFGIFFRQPWGLQFADLGLAPPSLFRQAAPGAFLAGSGIPPGGRFGLHSLGIQIPGQLQFFFKSGRGNDGSTPGLGKVGHLPVGADNQGAFLFPGRHPFYDPVRGFTPVRKDHRDAFVPVSIRGESRCPRTVENHGNFMGFYTFVSGQQVQQRFSPGLEIQAVQPAQVRGLANEIVAVDDDMNRQTGLAFEQTQQAVKIVVAVKLNCDAALLLFAINPDPGAEMAGEILFQSGKIEFFRICGCGGRFGGLFLQSLDQCFGLAHGELFSHNFPPGGQLAGSGVDAQQGPGMPHTDRVIGNAALDFLR